MPSRITIETILVKGIVVSGDQEQYLVRGNHGRGR